MAATDRGPGRVSEIDETGEAVRRAAKLCFFAHYHPRGIVTDHVLHYLAALRDAGFTIVVASTAAMAPDQAERLRSACADLILRDNVGLDFGGWIDCWRKWAPLSADYLLLCNDSVYGPILDLGERIDALTRADADFYGMVACSVGGRHLQSWFVLLRDTAYRSAAFAEMMAEPVPASLSKDEIIEHYELGLTRRLEAAGLRSAALYEPGRDGLISRGYAFSPTHFLWRELVDCLGVPFIKVELLRDNVNAIEGVASWTHAVGARNPALVALIADDLASRTGSTVAARPEPDEAGVHDERRFMSQPEFRRRVAEDLRDWTGRRRLAAWLNLARFAAARFAFRARRRLAGPPKAVEA